MAFLGTDIERATYDLIEVIKDLTKSIEKASKTSSFLQTWLIVWTAIMSISIFLQVIILIRT